MTSKTEKPERLLSTAKPLLWSVLFCSIFISAGLVFAQGGGHDSPRFFSTLNDVPLMDGLEELLDQSVVFDKADGRIVESMAVGDDVAAEKIRSFYENTLPQLGWVKKGDGRYVRQDEVLQITIDKETGYNVVHVMVSPQ